MTTYIVTSNRLNGLTRGDILDESELGHLSFDLQFLLEAGHLSTYLDEKPAKTKTRKIKE